MQKNIKKIYYVWGNMKQRCDNPKNPRYSDWGGRGITYSKNWKHFKYFLQDMLQGYETGLSLDRIDNNGNYCKENCRWTSMKNQAINKRRISKKKNKSFISSTLDLTEEQYQKYLDLPKTIAKSLVRTRLVRGWSFEKAITTKPIIK